MIVPMRAAASLIIALELVFGLWVGRSAEPGAESGQVGQKLAEPDRPYGIETRVPWTTFRIIGSPEPPMPYQVRRVFPKL